MRTDKINFTKMHACGNDYIYFYLQSEERLHDLIASVPALSNRRVGIGGDGVVLILPSETADARMRMFNSDGSEGNMCGNAIRCVAKYLFDNRIITKTKIHIETNSGTKTLYITAENGETTLVKVDMGVAETAPGKIPVNLDGDAIIAAPITVGGHVYNITCVSMGNPHAVIFTDNVDAVDIGYIGPLIENHPLFPDRVNVEFAELVNTENPQEANPYATLLKTRVWERGAGATLSCGTGACAAVVAAVLNGYCAKDTDITVKLPGGELLVKYTEKRCYLTGGCVKVFEGAIVLEGLI